MSSTSIMWFRRDLRLSDLPALRAAAACDRVVPLFVVDPAFQRAGAVRWAALSRALIALDVSMDGALVLRHGDPTAAVLEVAAEAGAGEVFVSRDYTPYGRRRDADVAAALQATGRRLHGVGSPYAVAPGTVTKSDGSPYAVFTPFSRAWRASGWEPPAPAMQVEWFGAAHLRCDGHPKVAGVAAELPPIGEQAAADRWEAFAGTALSRYDELRNLPGVAGTSRLSADLRWGTVHPRQLLADLGDQRSEEVFASELAWREFYADVLLRRPDSAWRNLDRRMDEIVVDDDDRARHRFGEWCSGRTGYPIVDAGMRQLLATGWMHNRVRMITGSFLVKDLHLPWQWGARHFLDHLIDGDLASNNHGWQWVAGSGTDAAPYFRVFNPTAQSERFDADGEYIRTWVPELAGLSTAAIHQPGAKRPDDYPAPIVDHAAEREEALSRHKAAMACARERPPGAGSR